MACDVSPVAMFRYVKAIQSYIFDWISDAMFWRYFWKKNIDVNIFDNVLKNTKHRANDASNDANLPPLVWTQRGHRYWQQTRVLEPDNDTAVPETRKDPGVVTINMDPCLAPELQDFWLAPEVLVWLWAALAHILTPCTRVGSSYTTPIESKQLLLSSLLKTLSLWNLFYNSHVYYDVRHIVPVFFEIGLLSQDTSCHMCACYQGTKEYDRNSSCYQLLQYSSS